MRAFRGPCAASPILVDGVAQVAYAKAFLASHGLPGPPSELTNVVFMGMGETLWA
jgi:adenine C2-methylase RlmN of 23S rRNA A2503 and tRNA A37